MKISFYKKIMLLTASVLAFNAHAQDTKSVPEQFSPTNSAILLVDHQKTTMDWIHSQDATAVKRNLRMLARMGNELNIPLLITTTMGEQVGHTWDDIQQLAPNQYAHRIKRGGTINAFMDKGFANAVKSTGKNKLIIAGLTSDICLLQTVKGALRANYQVMVVADASGSMTTMADDAAFATLRQMGAQVVSANSVLSELYNDFGTPDGQKAMQINLQEVVSKLGQ